MSSNTGESPRLNLPQVAISATFTADPIADTLRFWGRELAVEFVLKFAPYNQVFQQILDQASLLALNRDGVNVILIRLEDWSLDRLEQDVQQFIAGLHASAPNYAAPVIVCLCPCSPEFLSSPDRAALVARLQDALAFGLHDLSTVHLITTADLNRLYPVTDYYDAHSDRLGHIPYTPLFFAALGTALARRIHVIRSAPWKVIALDCDETLWQGICGEDGPQGITVDPPRRQLQEFMLAQQQAGMLLCLDTKNNEEDVLETFRLNPDMPLGLQHFVASRINWEPKSANLISLAQELDLSLDSFILVDDNPKECGEARANCPDVLTLQLPADPGDFPHFLQHVWAFDHVSITEEDRKRTEMYAQRIERSRVERQALSLGQFIAALELEVLIAPVRPDQLPRVSQLTQRTSQMNASGIRRSESELREIECLTAEVKDRFGSYGLTGVMLFQTGPAHLYVDTFLLSCRALGRGVEHRMLAKLGETAQSRGLAEVHIPFVPTHRNKPALLFLQSVGAQFQEASNDGLLFRFPAAYAAKVSYESSGAGATLPLAQESAPVRKSTRRRIDYGRIAINLRDPAEVLRRIAEHHAALSSRNGAASLVEAPRTDLEGELASIWTNLLHVPSIGVNDNFFDIGGHSLLAVQLLSIVQKTFNVDLSLKLVYSGAFTIAELAKAIELHQIEQSGADEYAALLAELESLSDEEAAALLAQESSQPPDAAI
jgi:FkbH-like protein